MELVHDRHFLSQYDRFHQFYIHYRHLSGSTFSIQTETNLANCIGEPQQLHRLRTPKDLIATASVMSDA